MIWILFGCLMALILSPVISVIYSIYQSKRNLKFYQDQGMLTYFNPFIGFFGLFSKNLDENKHRTNMEYIIKLVNSNKQRGMLACNMPTKSQSVVFLYSSEMVKEFLLNDESLEKFTLVKEMTDINSFFFKNGEEAFRVKSLFIRIFSYDSMGSLHESMTSLITRYIKKFNEEASLLTTDYRQIDLKDFFNPLMAAVANHVLLGGTELDMPGHIEELNSMVSLINKAVFGILRSPLFTLIPNIAQKLCLIPEFTVIEKSVVRMREIVGKILVERETREDLGECVLDRIIKHNRECKEKGTLSEILDLKEITGIYSVFFFAGTDTSMVNTIWALTHLADKPDLQSQIKDIADEVYDMQGNTTRARVEGNGRLDMLVKESLRLFSPLQRQLNRVIMRDIKLGKYRLKKGDYVTILYGALHRDPEVWKNPDTFKLDRFTKETEKILPKYQVVPFSLGRRVCLGRHMGEMMIKLLLTNFVRSYEISKPANHEYYNENLLTCESKNPIVNLRLRK